jgi:lysophospholipase L1-like esterase
MRKLLALALVAAAALAAFGFDRVPGAWRVRRWLTRAPDYGEHRRERIERFERERSVAPGTVVFVGSSTIERFPLERCFPGRATANRGIGNEPLTDLAARIPSGMPEGALGGVVVYAASVDARGPGARADEIALRVERLLDSLAAAVPGVPLCLVAPLPERAIGKTDAERLAQLERELRAVCEGRQVAFVATHRAPLLGADGLSEVHSVDRLHLNDAGYDVLARWIVEDGGAVGRALAP